MLHCKNCGIRLSGKYYRCPLCKGELTGTSEETGNVFPVILPRREAGRSLLIWLGFGCRSGNQYGGQSDPAVRRLVVPVCAWRNRKHLDFPCAGTEKEKERPQNHFMAGGHSIRSGFCLGQANGMPGLVAELCVSRSLHWLHDRNVCDRKSQEA